MNMGGKEAGQVSDDDFDPKEFEKKKTSAHSKLSASTSMKKSLFSAIKTRKMPKHADREETRPLVSKDIKTRQMPNDADREDTRAPSSRDIKTKQIPPSDRMSRDPAPRLQRENLKMPDKPKHKESRLGQESHSNLDLDRMGYRPKAESSKLVSEQPTKSSPKVDRTWERDTSQFVPKPDRRKDQRQEKSKSTSSHEPTRGMPKADRSKDPFHDSKIVSDKTRNMPLADREQSKTKPQAKQTPMEDRRKDLFHDSNKLPDRTRNMPQADRDQSKVLFQTKPMPKAGKNNDGNKFQTRKMPLADRSQSSRPQSKIPDKLKTFIAQSRAPKSIVSKHRTHEDQEFARRQTEIENLSPQERQKQDEWVNRQFTQFASTCPMTFGWTRIGGGYLCQGGSHLVTDELLAEGKGGLMLMPRRVFGGQLLLGPGLGPGYLGVFGPYYPHLNPKYADLGVFTYCGEEPIPLDAQWHFWGIKLLGGISFAGLSDPARVQIIEELGRVNEQKRRESVSHSLGEHLKQERRY